MNNIKIALGVALVAMVIAIGGYFFPQVPESFGAATVTGQIHQQLEGFVQGLLVGSTGGANQGTSYRFIRSGTCTLQANNSIAATTTGNVSCTGITGYVGASGDIVRLSLAASTTLASQYVIVTSYASTTASASVESRLLNLTGAAATPAATNGFGSSTLYQIFRPQ